jgi:uncharacterized Fe-S cluster protein YjdI
VERRYTRDGVTVIWRPARCWHSGICARGLPKVFDPARRPWVQLEHEDINTIVEQVNRCPSRALTWEPAPPQPET